MTTPAPEESAASCGQLTCRVSTLPTVTPMLSGLTIYKDGREVGFIPADGLAELRKVILDEANAATITPEERAAEIIRQIDASGLSGGFMFDETKSLPIIASAIREAVEQEREACEKIAEQWGRRADVMLDTAFIPGASHDEKYAAEGIAAAIRARATPAKE